MTGSPNAENIVASGPKGTVEYAVRADGTIPVKEWLESQDLSIQASFGVLFERLVTNGPLFPNKEQFKKFSDGVWEFKRGGEAGNRIFCYEHGRRWLLTNHYKKGGSKRDQQRASKLAEKIAEEHLERERNIVRQSNASGETNASQGPDHEQPGGTEGLAPGTDDLRDDQPDL